MRRGRDEKDELERPNYAGAASASSGSGQRPFEQTGTISAGGGGGSAGAGLPALRIPQSESASDRNTYRPPESYTTPDVLGQARALVRRAIGGGSMQTRMPAVLSSLVAEHAQVVVPYRADAILSFTSPHDYMLFGLDEYADRKKRSERYRIHAFPAMNAAYVESSELVILALNDNNPCVRRVNYMNIDKPKLLSDLPYSNVIRYHGSGTLTSLVAHPRRRSRMGLPPPTLVTTEDVGADNTTNGFETRTWVEAAISAPPGVALTLPVLSVYAPTSAAPAPLPILDNRADSFARGLTASDSGRFLFFRTGRTRLRNGLICITVVDLQTRIQQTLVCEKRTSEQGGGIVLVDVAASLDEVASMEAKRPEPAEPFNVNTPTLRRIIGSHDVMIEDADEEVDTMTRLRWRAPTKEGAASSWSTPDPVYTSKKWPDMFGPFVIYFDTTIGYLKRDLSGMSIYPFLLADVDINENDPSGELTRCEWEKPDMTGIDQRTTPTIDYWSLETGRVIVAMQYLTNVIRGGMFADDSPLMDARADFSFTRRTDHWNGFHLLLLDPDVDNAVTAAKRKAASNGSAAAAQAEEEPSTTKQRRIQSSDVKAQPISASLAEASGLNYQGWIRGTLSVASPSDWTQLRVLAMCGDGHFYALFMNERMGMCVLVKARMVNRRVQFVARSDPVDQEFVYGNFQVDVGHDRVISLHRGVVGAVSGANGIEIKIWQFQPGSSRVRIARSRFLEYTILAGDGDTRNGAIPSVSDIDYDVLSSDGSHLAVIADQSSGILRVYDLWSKPDTQPLDVVLLKQTDPIEGCDAVRSNDGRVGFVTYSKRRKFDETYFRMWRRGEDLQWKAEAPMMLGLGINSRVSVWFRDFCLVKLPNNEMGGYVIGTYATTGIVEDHNHPLARLIQRTSMTVIKSGDGTTLAFEGRVKSTSSMYVNDAMLQRTESDMVTRTGTAVDAPDDCDGIWDDMESDGMADLSFQPGRVLSDSQRTRALAIAAERDKNGADSDAYEDSVAPVVDARPGRRGTPLILYVCNYAGGPVRTVAATATATASAPASTAK